MDLQGRVYKYFTDFTGVRSSLNTAILVWQAHYGYISPSITMNWMAIAQDYDLRYIGDLDIQNKFALGIYQLDPVPEQTVTLSTGSFDLTGFPLESRRTTVSLEPGILSISAPELYYDPPMSRPLRPGELTIVGGDLSAVPESGFGSASASSIAFYLFHKEAPDTSMTTGTFSLVGGDLDAVTPGPPFGTATVGQINLYLFMKV